MLPANPGSIVSLPWYHNEHLVPELERILWNIPKILKNPEKIRLTTQFLLPPTSTQLFVKKDLNPIHPWLSARNLQRLSRRLDTSLSANHSLSMRIGRHSRKISRIAPLGSLNASVLNIFMPFITNLQCGSIYFFLFSFGAFNNYSSSSPPFFFFFLLFTRLVE